MEKFRTISDLKLSNQKLSNLLKSGQLEKSISNIIIDWDNGEQTFWYGDFEPDNQGIFIEIPYCTFSDYSGGTVEKSNFLSWCELYEDSKGVIWKELQGGFYTRGIIAKIESLTDSMVDTIEDLLQYPVINEEKLSQLEYDILIEQANEYYIPELMQKKHISKKKATAMFWQAYEDGEIEPIYENHYSCYIDISRI